MIRELAVNGRPIGLGRPVYIVAELSANHGQQYDNAVRLVHAAHEAGADAVKLQTYTADTLTIRCGKAPFRISGGTLWDGRTLYDLYEDAYTPWEWQPGLRRLSNDLGLEMFSTPFDESAVEFLENMGVAAHKVASFELVDIPLIKRIAKTGKPIIMSTGMASQDEIQEALDAARDAGAKDIALLKCTSGYPARSEDMNLRTIPDMIEKFCVPVGLSDHSPGFAVPVAAVALGACIVEKHLTLSRANGGPDAPFSLEPQEFRAMVDAIRTAEKAMGGVHYGLTEAERKSSVFRRSLFAVEDIKAGDPFSPVNVRSIRPAGGLHPRYLPSIWGCAASVDIERGTPLAWEHFVRPPS